MNPSVVIFTVHLKVREKSNLLRINVGPTTTRPLIGKVLTKKKINVS